MSFSMSLVISYVFGPITVISLYDKFKVCELKKNLRNGLGTQLPLMILFLKGKYISSTLSKTHKIQYNSLFLKISHYFCIDICICLTLCQLGVMHSSFEKKTPKNKQKTNQN